MVVKITKLSGDVLKILGIMSDAEKIPAPQEHVLTEEEIKLIADLRDPGVEEAFNLGLLQLRDALVEDLASRGPLPASVVEALELTPPVTLPVAAPDMADSANYYPNAFYDYNSPTNFFTQNRNVPPPQLTTPPRTQSPPRSGSSRRPPSKRKYEGSRNSPFARCHWKSCGQVIENSSSAIVSHLLIRHKIDQKSRNGTMTCEWTGCGEDLLITSVAKHITSTHLRLTVVQCPYCPDEREFSRVDSLNAHIKTRHPDMYDGPSPKKLKAQ